MLNLPQHPRDRCKLVLEMIFDYVGCIYLITKIKQVIHHCHREKLNQQNRLDVSFTILNQPGAHFRGSIRTFLHNQQFFMKFEMDSN